MDVEKVQNLPMDFSNGVAAVQVMLGNGDLRAGIIDSLGKWVRSPDEIEMIYRFDEFGFAKFKKIKKNKLMGLMKKDGKILVEPKYTFIDGFVNGYARVRSSRDYWGLIDMKGREVIPLKYMAVDSVSQDLVAVKFEVNQWRFLDMTGKTAIAGPFESTQEFVDNITMVIQEGKKKVIGRKGEEIRLRFGQPLFVSDGIIGVAANRGKNVVYYYADASGNNLYGRYFNEISPFKLSSASIKVDSKVYELSLIHI